MICFVDIEIVGIFPRLITNAQNSALCAILKIYSKIIHIVNYNLCNIVWQYLRRIDNFQKIKVKIMTKNNLLKRLMYDLYC